MARQSIYSRSNYMHVKLRFHCNYAAERPPAAYRAPAARRPAHVGADARTSPRHRESSVQTKLPLARPSWLGQDSFSLGKLSFDDKQRHLDELSRRTALDN